MYIGNLKHSNYEINLTRLIILVTAIKVKSNFFQFNRFHDLRNLPYPYIDILPTTRGFKYF